MNHIDDERVAFYLRHQQRIEEWAALAGDTAKVAHGFMCSLADDLDQLAKELGSTVIVAKDMDNPSYPSFLLAVPEWYVTPSMDELRVGVGIVWHRTSGLGFTIPEKCAHTGVWANRDLDGGLKLSRELKAAFGDAGLLREHELKSYVWWPAYRWEIATGDFWKDLSPYRKQILDSIRFFWRDFTPIIHQTLSV